MRALRLLAALSTLLLAAAVGIALADLVGVKVLTIALHIG